MTKQPSSENPNQKLRQAREEHQWTQQETASRIGVDERTYRRWENEGVIPQRYAQRQILDLFNEQRPEDLGFIKRLPSTTLHPPSVSTPETDSLSPPSSPRAGKISSVSITPRKSLPRIGRLIGTLVIIFFVVLLAVALRLPPAASQTHPTTPPRPHTVSIYPYIRSAQLIFSDPLQKNIPTHQWIDSPDRNGACSFKEGAYHVTAHIKTFHYCITQLSTYTDVVYEVKMTFLSGSEGGLVFGEKDENMSFFVLYNDGVYGLYAYHARIDTLEGSFTQGKGPLMPRVFGLSESDLVGQTVRLAVLVHNGHCDLYVNQYLIESGVDTPYKSGYIGVFAGAEYNSHTIELAFNDAKVWTLS
jgi:DNA-binding XRE family transcriptional regulator